MAKLVWDLESEIIRLPGANDIYEGLHLLKIIADSKARPEIIRDPDWVRGGAETYIYRFWLQDREGELKGFIIKACAAFSLALSLEAVLDSWLSRRRLLADTGVSTPQLFACKQGVIVEELIPCTIEEALKAGKELEHLLYGLADLAAAYSAHGFAPIDGFSDLRSHGSDIVVVDFGEDLGPANVLPPGDPRVLHRLMKQLSEWQVDIDREQELSMSRIFEHGKASRNSTNN